MIFTKILALWHRIENTISGIPRDSPPLLERLPICNKGRGGVRGIPLIILPDSHVISEIHGNFPPRSLVMRVLLISG